MILYEDSDVLVINKPSGLVVHADGRTKEPTVVDWVLANRPDIKGVGDKIKDLRLKILESSTDNLNLKSDNSIQRPGIVHRLDRETSGALLIAKNQIAFARLKKQFQRQQVHKTYHAFVYGNVKNDDGLIDRPIARSRSNPVLWSATRGRKGEEREAVTEYKVLARLILPYQGERLPSPPARGGDRGVVGAARRGVRHPHTDTGFSFLELFPRTGRTHQIRVHLKAINYPVVCDRLYASNKDCAIGFNRLALHSRSISFVHPSTGKRITVEAPYPKDFEEVLKISRKHQ